MYLQNRLRAILSKIPDRDAQTQRLLRISEYLEKVQFLTPEDLDSLMAPEKAIKPGQAAGRTTFFMLNWNFFRQMMSY